MTSRALRLVFPICILAGSVWGQNEAALSGTVQDSSGAVLPQATVKLTSREQGIVRTVQTNGSGVYQFSFIQPGTYDVEISANGFKTLTRTNLTPLAAAQNARQDFTLELGNVSENVTVSAATESVNTESAEVGTVVDNTRVVETPLNSRLFFALPLLTPGVMPGVQGGSAYRGAYNVAGSCEGCNNTTLNGFDNNDPTVNVPNFRPSIDAIAEFNVLTGVYPAQYGYGSGGQTIMTTKSGGNTFHGTAFDFLRNQAVLTARNFFAAPGAIPPFKRNQFGATLGGPIRKDKTFFFYSFEGLRLSQTITALDTVPTAAMDSGDFSATAKTIKDPTTGSPFPGNIIPQSRLNPVAQALLPFYPAPTFATPFGTVPSNNYTFDGVRPERMNEDSMRLDHVFGAKDSAYVTANYYKDHSVEYAATSCNSAALPAFNCDLILKSQLYGIVETHIFSPSMVNEARIAFSMTLQPEVPTTAGINFWGPFGVVPLLTSSVGIPNVGPPGLTVTGYTSFVDGKSFRRADPHWQYNDTFSWTYGKHTLKIGGNLTHYASNNLNYGNQAGGLAFTNTSQGPTTGYGIADLLLGLPQSTTDQPIVNKGYLRNANIYAFIQDDYKVNTSLTINLGLRWEMNTPPIDYAGHLANFDPAKGIQIIQGNTPYLQYQTDNLGEHVIHFDWHDYAPRLGFAWQPFHDGKTVVRGGAGTFFNNLSAYGGLGNIYATYPIKNTFTSSLTQPILLSNPFPASNAVVANAPGGADQNFRNARTYEWSLGVQRQLTRDMLAEITYFGSAANHLNVTQNINQPAPGAGTPAQVNARRPYPQYGTISYTEWDGNSHFNSLQAKLQKRYGYGLSFLVSYTFSKSIDDISAATNAYNLQTARGLSGFNVPQRLVLSPVYELPFGKGKPFASQGILAEIAGGWQLSPLFQWQTGNPLTATLSGNYSNTGDSVARPNLVGNPNTGIDTPQEWFNTAAFQVPIASGQAGAQYTFGNEGRSVITGPGLVNLDVSIVRNFQIREWLKLQFRAEFFDALNHPNFNYPNVVADTPSFGTITGALDPRESQFALKLVF